MLGAEADGPVSLSLKSRAVAILVADSGQALAGLHLAGVEGEIDVDEINRSGGHVSQDIEVIAEMDLQIAYGVALREVAEAWYEQAPDRRILQSPT